MLKEIKAGTLVLDDRSNIGYVIRIADDEFWGIVYFIMWVQDNESIPYDFCDTHYYRNNLEKFMSDGK